MPHWQSLLHHRSGKLAIAALTVFSTGLIYYLFWRILPVTLPDFTNGSYPSLVHALSLTWLALASTGSKRGTIISIALLVISLLAEHFFGYFYRLDAAMLVAGFSIGIVTGVYYLRQTPHLTMAAPTSLAAGALTGFCAVFILGSGCIYCGEPWEGSNARPVYMSYNELRSAITVSPARPLTDTSRVYIYQSYVFLNNPNYGIHVIDNSDPTNPLNIGFIEIPGNTELSIRNNYMYVDSYIDLVTLNIADPQNVQEVDRDIDIFPYDAYQNIPDDIYFSYGDIDENRGVVISYVQD